DKLNGWPTQDHLAPLSFVPASGFMKLTADGDTNAGANHLNFQLDHDRGEIALFNAQQTLVDSLFYAAQSSGVSEGLSPDGSANYVFFNQPSPGLSNPGTQNQETTINVVKLGDSWKFNQTDLFNDSSWAQSGFNDGTANWQPGATVIYHEDSALPWAKNTEIADATHPYSNTRRVYYFRKTFNIADPSQIKSLTLNVLIDDGAVFYVNGQEIPGTRYNMPGGAVNSTTLASASIGNASSIETYSIPVSMLVAGNNVLAIEVHQNFGTGTTSTDVVMGATLDAVQQADNTPPPPLRVTELMYNPPGSPNVNGDENEFIELQNVGASPLNITGYRFNGGVQFTFPNLTLAPGQKTLIVKDLAAFTARYGNSLPVAGEYLDSLDNNGELIRLETNAGQLVQQFTYSDAWYPSTDGNGDSLVINNPSADPSTWSNASSWHASTATLGTPGIDETTSPPQHAVVVNEVLANSPTGPNDWIELKNTTGAAINISGWYLSDSGDNLLKYRIPDGTILPANGFLTFDEQRTFGSIANGANAFSLSSTGDDVYISSSATAGVLGAYRDAAHFGASDPNVTLGRYQTSTGRVDFVALTKATKGADNAGPLVGPVVINELMYHPDGSGDEYIELRNITSSTVPLYDPANPNDTWKLTDGVDFTFPTGLSLAPGEIMLVIPESISVADFRAKYGIPASVQVVGGYIGVLSNSGEHVELAKPGAPQPDLTVPYIKVDDVEYGTGGTWPASPDGDGPSLVRFVDTHYGNDVANWRASVQLGGTPGQPNDVSPLTAAGSFVEVAANRLVFLFSKNVVGGISTADLQLTNLTTGAPVPQSAMSVTYDAAANIATFTFPGLANGQLAAGRYRAVLLSNGVASGGQALDGNGDGNPGDDYVFDFVHLPGDLNGDAKVDFADYQAFELNYGKTSGATWADGDWNYDGAVNDADTAILFANLGTVLAPAPALPAQSPTPAPVPSKPAPAPTPKPAPKPVTKKTTKPVAKPTATRQATTTNPTNPFSATKIVKTKATTGAVWA
ncbi:MAG TPA: lamin tail domain-containing protein, partial [Tepidisphaeraceae bacterium]